MVTKHSRRKLYEIIVEEIGLRILKGDYQIGETLPNEDSLSKELDISRGALREATKVLTQKGLIQTRPRTGTQVNPRSNWNLFDRDVLTWQLQLEVHYSFLKKVTEVRSIIESEAARFAAQRADKKAVDYIHTKLMEMQIVLEGASGYDYQDYLEKDMAFHIAVMKASNNELLSQIAFTMRQAVLEARQMDIQDRKVHRESLRLHRQIFKGVEARDPQAAYDASREMFEQVWQHIPKE